LPETQKLIGYLDSGDFINKLFGECSTGMKKKIQIIISLIGEIDTIIWDEPNDGIDIITNMKIKSLLAYYKSKGITILFSCHVIEFLENFIDYYILLKDGSVIEKGETKDLFSLSELYLKHTDKDSFSMPFI
jgi:ABC-type multidrug transport system ATPase subunit